LNILLPRNAVLRTLFPRARKSGAFLPAIFTGIVETEHNFHSIALPVGISRGFGTDMDLPHESGRRIQRIKPRRGSDIFLWKFFPKQFLTFVMPVDIRRRFHQKFLCRAALFAVAECDLLFQEGAVKGQKKKGFPFGKKVSSQTASNAFGPVLAYTHTHTT
jgi:hypothetical protein